MNALHIDLRLLFYYLNCFIFQVRYI